MGSDTHSKCYVPNPKRQPLTMFQDDPGLSSGWTQDCWWIDTSSQTALLRNRVSLCQEEPLPLSLSTSGKHAYSYIPKPTLTSRLLQSLRTWSYGKFQSCWALLDLNPQIIPAHKFFLPQPCSYLLPLKPTTPPLPTLAFLSAPLCLLRSSHGSFGLPKMSLASLSTTLERVTW